MPTQVMTGSQPGFIVVFLLGVLLVVASGTVIAVQLAYAAVAPDTAIPLPQPHAITARPPIS